MTGHDGAADQDQELDDARRNRLWLGKRMTAMTVALAAAAAGDFADRLVLRGSILMRLWFGEQAREPGDLDFVVDDAAWSMDDARTDRLFDQIAAGAQALAERDGAVRFDARQAISDEVWTYDEVPGQRLFLPWTAEGLSDGCTGMDFAFGENLPEAARPIELWPVAGTPTVLRAASRELSLAWKLLWLAGGMEPQAKDLYDAVLLAEAVRLPLDLLKRVANPSSVEAVLWSDSHWADFEEGYDWETFRDQYPGLAAAGPQALLDRLRTALAPTFAEESGDAAS